MEVGEPEPWTDSSDEPLNLTTQKPSQTVEFSNKQDSPMNKTPGKCLWTLHLIIYIIVTKKLNMYLEPMVLSKEKKKDKRIT